jgi:hypothetical protein
MRTRISMSRPGLPLPPGASSWSIDCLLTLLTAHIDCCLEFQPVEWLLWIALPAGCGVGCVGFGVGGSSRGGWQQAGGCFQLSVLVR